MYSPALLLILGGVVMLFARGTLFRALTLLTPLITLYALMTFSPTVSPIEMWGVATYDVMVRPYSTLFACGFTFVAWLAGIMGVNTSRPRELGAGYIYAGSAVGIAYAADYMSLLVFWEMMAIVATILIWSGRQKDSAGAGMRYAMMHVLGGILFLLGVSGKIAMGGGGALSPLEIDWASFERSQIPDMMIAIAVLLNIAAPPFSAWVADSYAEASPSGAVLLSACTTKASIFVLLTLFAGNHFLFPIGGFMMLYGLVYALFAVDMRKILSYLLISGLGVMVVGVDLGTPLAQAGVALFALAHMIYGAVLFIAAGMVMERSGTRTIHGVRDLYAEMPVVALAVIIALLSALALPFSLSFIAKSLILKVAEGEELRFVLWFFATTVVMAVPHFIFPYFVFFKGVKPSRIRGVKDEGAMACALGAALLLLLGFYPKILNHLMPAELSFAVHDVYGVGKQLILILASLILFRLLLPWLSKTRAPLIDMDVIYRKGITRVFSATESVWNMLIETVQIIGTELVQRLLGVLKRYSGEQKVLSRTWSIGGGVLAMTAMLFFTMLYYLFR